MTRYDEYTDKIIQEGWACPRCGRINAPWVSYCDCSEFTTTATTDGTCLGKTIYGSYFIKPNDRGYEYTTTTAPEPSTKTIHDGNHFAKKTILDGWESELYMKELEKNQRTVLGEDDYE